MGQIVIGAAATIYVAESVTPVVVAPRSRRIVTAYGHVVARCN